MVLFENAELEFKSQFVPELKKTFVAFANTKGGDVLIGVDDSGKTLGLADPDATLQQVISTIRDNVRPDLAQFFSAKIVERDGLPIVAVTIRPGTLKPYYLAGKGIRPEGVFVRKGSSTVSAGDNEIVEMIKTSSGNDYEKTISLNQNLTFEAASAFFAKNGREFGSVQLNSLGAASSGGFTNLGLLFSDQCPFSIKLARFSVDANTRDEIFLDRLETQGSIFRQLEQAEEWLDKNNRRRAVIRGFNRENFRDYPPRALREALLNAIVHRDYAFNGSILINIFDACIEVISIGGLVKGLNLDDVMLGVSRPRNVLLATAFVKLNQVEGWGSGIRSIRNKYSQNSAQPRFEVSPHAVKVTLPILDAKTNASEKGLSDVQTRILEYLKLHGTAPRKDLVSALNISQTSCLDALRQLTAQQLITRDRSGRTIFYRVASPAPYREN